MGQISRLILFSFIYFFLLSFFICYLKAPISNLAADNAIVIVVPHVLQVHTQKLSLNTTPALPVPPSQVHPMRSVSHIVRYKNNLYN
jgi:hypothetical protein